jgi:hypothetical protein
MGGQLQAPAETCEYRTKRNGSAKVGNEIIRMGEIRKRYKTRNVVGSEVENEEIKGGRGTKERRGTKEKEGIQTSQRRSQIFSTPKARCHKPDKHCSPPHNATFLHRHSSSLFETSVQDTDEWLMSGDGRLPPQKDTVVATHQIVSR